MKSIFKILDNKTVQKALKATLVVFIFVYTFSISAFGEQNFKRIPFLNYGIYLVYASMALLFVTTIFSIIAFKINTKCNRAYLIIPLFTLYALIGTAIYSKDIRGWITLVLLTLSFFAFIYCFRVLKNKCLILIVIALALFSFTIFYLIYYVNDIFDFRGFFSGKNRLGSDFDNQNGVAVFAVVLFGVSSYLFAFYKKRTRFLFVLPIVTSLWVGVTTGSRTFIITSYIIIAILLFFYFYKHKFVYLVLLFVLTTSIIFALNSLAENRLWAAIETFFGIAQKSDTATLSRELYLDYGLLLGARNAIFGFGVNGFGLASGVGTYAHNNFAEVLCDFGIIGLVLFYLPFLVFIVRTICFKKIDKSFVFLFVIYYLIASFSNVIYYKKLYYLILAFLFYLCFEERFVPKNAPLVPSLKKVLFTCDTMGSGGAEKVISVLANEMAFNGIKISIIGVADTNAPNSFYKLEKNVRYENLRLENGKKANLFQRAHLLRKRIKSLKPDLVISFLPNANIYTWIALVGLKIPHIVSERNNPYLDPKQKITRFLKKMSFRFSNACVFQTNDAKCFYSARIQKKGIIIKNPIILNSEPCDGLTPKNNVILAVGRLTEQKNYRCLLDSFKIFNEAQDNEYILKIYGDGPLKDDLERYCDLLGIKESVRFLGNDAKWHEKEKNDAMYILSSNYEGMPNALAEAMALGIPCISTDCPSGGSRELIKDCVNGFLTPVNNSQELSQKMIELVNNGISFYSETRDMIEEYSPKNITNQWIGFIESLSKEIYE